MKNSGRKETTKSKKKGNGDNKNLQKIDGVHVGADGSFDSNTIPKFVSRINESVYIEMINRICRGTLSNITTFCRKHDISRETLYIWLRKDETVQYINDFIEASTNADRVKIRNTIKSQIKSNAAYARLYSEKYEKWTPEETKTPPLNINFNFFNTAPATPEPVEVTDAEVVEEDTTP
jgi:hypothetical protein